MIEPSKVKEAFNRIEAENYVFRAYLKINSNDIRVNEIIVRVEPQ